MMVLRRLVCAVTVFAMGFSTVIIPSSYAQELPHGSGNILRLTPLFHPMMIQGMRVHPQNPFQLDFILDTGDTSVDVHSDAFKAESAKLIKYFLACLTVPEKEMWVNLSPYEKNRIIAQGLGQTQLGADMLAQDFILKQLTSSLMYPDSQTGKTFWQTVYTKTKTHFGITNIPINTFNKVWIVPDKAVVYQKGNTVYVLEKHLKVMLEEDYLSTHKHADIGALYSFERQPGDMFPRQGGGTCPQAGCQASTPLNVKATQVTNQTQSIIREIIIPELEKEVNQGQNFANLRQIYNSMILAVWFKVNLQKSLLGQVYANQNKTSGVDAADQAFRMKIYNQYLNSFKKGAYNFIREENDPLTGISIPRKYFSGGVLGLDAAMLQVRSDDQSAALIRQDSVGKIIEVDSAMKDVGPIDDPVIHARFTRSNFLNHITNGSVPAHIAVRHEPNQSDYVIAFPKENPVGFYWNFASDKGDFTEDILDPVPVIMPDGFMGIDSEISLEGSSGETSVNLSNINLRDIPGVRGVLFNNSLFPKMERELKDYVLNLPSSYQEKLKEIMGVESFEEDFITPMGSLERQNDGSHLIRVTKTAFNKHRYHLQITVPAAFRVIDDGHGSFKIEGAGKLKLHVRAMTDYKPLTQLPIKRIFNAEAQQMMDVNPEFKKKAEYFSLLFRQEKLLAGSWIYLSYFGRDSLQGAALMWPALSSEAKMIIVRSILDRINDDGTVAVSDEDLGDRGFQLTVLEPFHRLLQNKTAHPDTLLDMFSTLLQNQKNGTLKYNVLDSTFLFSGMLKLLFKELSDDELEGFLDDENARGEKNIVTILRHSNRILGLTDPYTRAILKLRQENPGVDITTLKAFKSEAFQPEDFNPGQAQQLIDALVSDGFTVPHPESDPLTRMNDFIKDPNSWKSFDEEFRKKHDLKIERQLNSVEIRFLLERRYPALTPKGVATQLIGLEPDSKDANWRDSDWGNAGGIFVADINISLAPMAIKNIMSMIKRIEGLNKERFNLPALAGSHPDFKKFEDYLEEKDGIGLQAAREAWGSSIEHFKNHLTAQELRDEYKAYLEKSILAQDMKDFFLKIRIGEDDSGKQITLQEFLEDDKIIPTWLKDGFEFTSVALGKKVMHTDEVYSLLYDDEMSSKELRRILANLFAPHPLGSWNKDIGLYISNAFLLKDDEIREKFEIYEYHSQNVVWSKPMGELAIGLIYQMRYAKEKGRSDDVKLLEEKLREVAKVDINVGYLREQEVWTGRPGEDGHMVPWPFVIEGKGGGQPSGEPQLWGLSALLLMPEYLEARKAVGHPPEVDGLLEAADGAMANGHNAADPGGIDLDAAMLNLQTKQDGKGAAFSTAGDSAMKVNGLTPVIIRIKQLNALVFSDAAS